MTEQPQSEVVQGMDVPPTPKQLHGLAGQLMKVAYESGQIRRRDYMNRQDAMKRFFLPEWSTSIEPLDGYGCIEQVDKRITASLGAVAHRAWSLRVRVIDTRASYANSTDEQNPLHAGPISAEQLFASVAPDVGLQSHYSFEWSRQGVTKAERRIKTVPSAGEVFSSYQLNPDTPQNEDIDAELQQIILLSELAKVSAADVNYLREEVEQYRSQLQDVSSSFDSTISQEDSLYL